LTALKETLKRRKPKQISTLLKEAETYEISSDMMSEFNKMCKLIKKYKYPEAQTVLAKILNELEK
jgi:hypothetical protein